MSRCFIEYQAYCQQFDGGNGNINLLRFCTWSFSIVRSKQIRVEWTKWMKAHWF